MTRQTRNWLIALLLIYSVPVFVVGGLVAFLVLRPLPPLPHLPNPNGYDDLLNAAKLVSTNTAGYAKMSVYQLRPLVVGNAGALSLARDGMDKGCGVPVQYSQSGQQNVAGNYTKLRRLGEAFAAEGRLAELDKRTGAAVDSYVDLMRLGAATEHGGILIDAMVGMQIESLGTTGLQKFVNQADAKTCRETAAALEALDAVRPSWQDVLQQEDNWIRRTFGARSVLIEFIYRQQLKQRNGQRAQKSYQAEQLKARRLMVDFASRAYELDKGHRPASAAELVPEYLKAVPKHPVTGKILN
jgi:hypothetical protein